MSQIQMDVLRCPYCHDSLAGEVLRAGCGACLAWHHRGCLAELGRCANCGAASTLAASAQELEAAMSRVLERSCQAQYCRSIDTITIRGSQLCLPHARSGPKFLLAVTVFLFVVSAAAWIPALAGEVTHLGEWIFLLVCSVGALLLGWQLKRYRRNHLELLAKAEEERDARLAAVAEAAPEEPPRPRPQIKA